MSGQLAAQDEFASAQLASDAAKRGVWTAIEGFADFVA
jgi:hypothetical protein